MFCQADQREVDAKLNPTVRNNEADPILLFVFLWDICRKSKEIFVIHIFMDHGWRFSYRSYNICNYGSCISHFLSELAIPV